MSECIERETKAPNRFIWFGVVVVVVVGYLFSWDFKGERQS